MKPLLIRVDAALFDLDGTLVETNIDFPLMKQSMIALAVEQGLNSAALVELDILAIIEHAANALVCLNKPDKAEMLRVEAMSILQDIELKHASNTQLIPFARDLILQLKCRGIGVGIVTRNCRKASEISLNIADISPDVLVCREDAAKHKPHPDPLYMALDKLGARADASVMVGDHIMDITSGRAAGMKTIGLMRDYHPCGFFDSVNPDLIVNNLKEVLRAIVDCDS